MKKSIFICFILIVCISMSLQAQDSEVLPLKHQFEIAQIHITYLDSIRKIKPTQAEHTERQETQTTTKWRGKRKAYIVVPYKLCLPNNILFLD